MPNRKPHGARTATQGAVARVPNPAGHGSYPGPVLTALGPGVVARRGLRASPAVEHALNEGLGTRWRNAVDAGRPPGRAAVR
ncbi:hypothetical protein [Allosalinactinospora lopnorensis]|uniref:hypothetical protein n=1 Tax=Allosalinactinospora lopnorensis TaxID=1352348 RepID=UPI000623DDAF|nr:hypothetical protein [Allosalinactinospora lopnorensis]